MLIMSRDARNTPDWFLYEQYVARVLAALDPGAVVEHHVRVTGRISGRPREIDVRVTGAVAGITVVIAVECKHLREPVGIDVVEGYLAKLADIGADLGLLASSSGFTEPAHRRAINSHCPRLVMEQVLFPVDKPMLADIQNRYVALHLTLDKGSLDEQHAYNMSRQYDDLARQLREYGSSGAEALTAYGLL
jgi:hypothetical protein